MCNSEQLNGPRLLGGLTKGRNSMHEKLYDLRSVFCQRMYDHEFMIRKARNLYYDFFFSILK